MRFLEPLNRLFGCGGVVAYHDVTRTPFSPAMHITVAKIAEQLEFLVSEGFHIIPLRELIERRRTGRSLRRCVALTFDDAYHGVLELALPLLERFVAPATVFVATAFARNGGARRYWWDRFSWVVERGGEHSDLVSALRDTGIDPHSSADAVRATLVASSAGRLNDAVESALTDLEHVIGVVPERSLAEPELQELARSSLIEFGCHTESHPALPILPLDEQVREIRQSYTWLAERLPRVRPFLAYPYGLYNRGTVQAARTAGMEAAFTIEGRATGPHFNPLTCHRIGMAEVNNLRSLSVRLSWLLRPLLALRNGGWHPRLPTNPTVTPAGAGRRAAAAF